jgi:hypothetical protein
MKLETIHGQRIAFSALPLDCQTLVNNDLKP